MLQVIGAGLSRTGTFSLKRALETVGCGPCYHMDEVFRRSDHVPLWAVALSGSPDWHALLDGYASAADAPVCHFWKSIRAAFPRAKVILTLRDAESWYDSFRDTVYQAMSRPDLLPALSRPALAMARQLVLERFFQGAFEDRSRAISIYEAHNAEVLSTVDPSDLLVYRVEEGWRPLCDFLGVAAPDVEFPNTNAVAQFRSRLGL
jgi:hypothetical protein